MALSIFEEKEKIPEDNDLKKALGDNYHIWNEIKEYVYLKYPEAMEKWSFPGKKYGWSYSLKDKKRAIIYMTPSDGYFMVGLVFGQKATDQAMAMDLSAKIKEIISEAKVYAEGRGFRIEIISNEFIEDIKKLIEVKLAN